MLCVRGTAFNQFFSLRTSKTALNTAVYLALPHSIYHCKQLVPNGFY